MPLAPELERARRFFQSRLTEDKAAILGMAEGLLRGSGILKGVAGVGAPMPQGRLLDVGGQPVDMADLVEGGPLVLSFFQGDWSPFCRAELTAYQRMLPYVKALQARLVGVSPLHPDRSGRLAADLGLGFPLLSDPGCRLAGRLGLHYELPPTVRAVFAQMGIDLPRLNLVPGRDPGLPDQPAPWVLPLPATLVVDGRGVIVRIGVDADVGRRLEPMDALQAVADLHQGTPSGPDTRCGQALAPMD